MSSISRQAPCLNLHRLENILLALDVFDNVRENIENHRDHELELDPLLSDEERLLINRRRNKRRRDRATLGVERLECIFTVLDSYDSLEARYRSVVSNGVDITVRRLEQILIAMGAFDEIIDDGNGSNALDSDDGGDDHDNATAAADNITTIDDDDDDDDDNGAYTDERPFRYVNQYRREDHIRSTTRPLLLRSHNDEETNTAANATPSPQPSSTLLSDNTITTTTNSAFSPEMPTDENIYELVTFRINNDGDDGGDENVGDVNNDDDADAGEHTSTYNSDSAIAAATVTVLAPVTTSFDGESSIMQEMIARLELLAMNEDESSSLSRMDHGNNDESSSLSRMDHGNNSSGSNNVAIAPSAPPLDEAEATQTVNVSTQMTMDIPPEEIYDEEDEAAAEAARRMVNNTGLARHSTRGKSSIVYPAYALLQERLKSFANWPIALIQKPKVMADAGFYYTNHGDQVVCFSCGLGMHRWLPEDDPWEKHAEYNIRDKCSYLYMMRDAAFIAKCKRRRQRVEATPPTLTSIAVKTQATDDDDDDDDKAEVKVVPPKCNYCLEYDCSIVFVPCGHFTSCSQCSFAFTACPICRRDISDKIKIFW
nr:IAP-3 protein [Oryctes rhinoceros nudivirus]